MDLFYASSLDHPSKAKYNSDNGKQIQ